MCRHSKGPERGKKQGRPDTAIYLIFEKDLNPLNETTKRLVPDSGDTSASGILCKKINRMGIFCASPYQQAGSIYFASADDAAV